MKCFFLRGQKVVICYLHIFERCFYSLPASESLYGESRNAVLAGGTFKHHEMQPPRYCAEGVAELVQIRSTYGVLEGFWLESIAFGGWERVKN